MTTTDLRDTAAADGTGPTGAAAAPNRTVQVGEDTFAYRRLGTPSATLPPLLLLQHFRGNLDFWDPILLDVLAADREVVTVDQRGVGASTGATRDDVAATATDTAAFAAALGLRHVDVLGFSLGGHVAQDLALRYPRLVRRLVLGGTAPQAPRTCTRGARTSSPWPPRTSPPPRTSSRCSSPGPPRAPGWGGSTWPGPPRAGRTATPRPTWRPGTRSTPP